MLLLPLLHEASKIETCKIYAELWSIPGLRWTWCWRAAPPPNVPPGTPWDPTTARWCGRRLPTRSYTGWRKGEMNAVTWMKRAIVALLSRGERTHHVQDFVLGFIHGAVLGGMLRKAQLPLEKCVRNRVIIGISAVGGYKQKSSSLAPITRHTPTQTCTNTKQMNHQCGGTSPSLSLSLPVFR